MTDEEFSAAFTGSFLRPMVSHGYYFEVETSQGETVILPDDVINAPFAIVFGAGMDWSADERQQPQAYEFGELCEAVRDYIDVAPFVTISRIEAKAGWLARMSAPGYMDCTDWTAHETQDKAREYLVQLYGNDDDADDENPMPLLHCVRCACELAQDQSGLCDSCQQDDKAALPADPEGMNDQRATWAEAALVTFATQTNQRMPVDNREIVAVMLADLMHWCDRNGMSFDDRLENARMHYAEETLDVDDAQQTEAQFEASAALAMREAEAAELLALRDAIKRIRAIPVNGNSEPDRMAEGLDEIARICSEVSSC